MSSGLTIVIILLAVLLLAGLLIIGLYNNLIRKRNTVDNAYYSIDVMLKKRYDLIPALIETVKGYMHHEKDLLLAITELRARVNSGQGDVNEKVRLDNEISQRIGQVLVSVEKYPDLKASDQFLRLQGALNETEEQLAASRRFYNAAVAEYHNAIQQFPSSVIAHRAGMTAKEYFSVPDEQKVPVTPVFN